MQRMLWAVIAAASLVSTPTEGRPRQFRQTAHAVRTVQLIAMPADAVAKGTPSETSHGAAADQAAAFHIHDLSRLWVTDQMRRTLEAPLGTVPLSSIAVDDPFAPQERAGDIPVTRLAATSSITVPGWMQRSATPPVGRFTPGCGSSTYRPSGFLGLATETRRQIYYAMMSGIACEYGLPVDLFDAMIIRESRYDPSIVSPKNAFGLTQLMPGTAAGLGVDRYDVAQNLRGGASYLRQQLDRYGQFHLALAAYNAGPGRVRDAVPRIAETRAYVDDILRNWSRLSRSQRIVAVRSLAAAPEMQGPGANAGAIVTTF